MTKDVNVFIDKSRAFCLDVQKVLQGQNQVGNE